MGADMVIYIPPPSTTAAKRNPEESEATLLQNPFGSTTADQVTPKSTEETMPLVPNEAVSN